MPAISAELKELMIETDLFVFPEDFVVVYLPQDIKAISGEWFRYTTTRFAMVIQEPKMITMVIPRRKWLRMQNLFEQFEANGPWKVISFKIKQSNVPPGYLATMGAVLKDSKIRSIPVSTLKNTYILVPKSDLPRAVRLLRDFLEKFKKKKKSGA
ncbi:MAG: ACT domain-containing protein [Acidobacteria bacterium]|nr:ACT domain-containing protein [Acidobacteriota bacterium]